MIRIDLEEADPERMPPPPNPRGITEKEKKGYPVLSRKEIDVIRQWIDGLGKKGFRETDLRESEMIREPVEKPNKVFYRRMLLNIPKEGKFLLELAGQKNITHISYKFDWDEAKLKNHPTEPVFLNSFDSDDRMWEDRVFTDFSNSRLEIEGLSQGPLIINCVYLLGQDFTKPRGKANDFPRFILKVQIVANDAECRGPKELNPNIYTTNTDLWETALTFQLRGDQAIFLKFPIEPKIKYLRNESYIQADIE